MSYNYRNKANIFGIAVDSGCKGEVLTEIVRLIKFGNKTSLIFTPNPAFILYAQKDRSFTELLNQADINLPDGFGFILYNQLMGWGISERVAGSDVVRDVLEIGNKEKWRVGLVGLRGGVEVEADRQLEQLKKKYQNISFCNLDKSVSDRNRYEVVFACHGMGKQEQWIVENKGKYKVKVMMGVGGSLDFLTGYSKRAPIWVQRIGFEWLWRVGQKPKHIKRALQSVLGFTWLVIRDKLINGKIDK